MEGCALGELAWVVDDRVMLAHVCGQLGAGLEWEICRGLFIVVVVVECDKPREW